MPYPHKRTKITETLERWFEEERFRPGDRFPSDHDLARKFRVNRLTVRAAIRPFVTTGRLERRTGSGTIVRAQAAPVEARARAALERRDAALPGSVPYRGVGLVIPDAGNGFHRVILRTVEDALLAGGRPLLLGQTCELGERERQLLSSWVALGVRTLVIAASGPDRTFYEGLIAQGVRLVLVDRRVPGLAAPAVTTSDEAGVVAAIDHLRGLGHRRIVHLAGPSTVWTARTRRQTFLERLAATGGTGGDSPPVVQASFTIEGGYRATKALLAEGPPPDAIFAANDPAAVGAMRALAERGLRVPDDVSVVGFGDDEDLGRSFGLTTVRQFPVQVAREAMRLLLSDGPIGAEQIEVAPELVVRTSTAARGPVA